MSLTGLTKSSILDVWQGSQYASVQIIEKRMGDIDSVWSFQHIDAAKQIKTILNLNIRKISQETDIS